MGFELNKGFAVIIDDQLHSPTDDITKIVGIVSENGIPYCGFKTLAEATKCIPNFLAVNFVILDWSLINSEVPVKPDALIRQNARANVKFIKEFQQHCFAPIFIFSSEERQDIIDQMFANGGEDLINETDESRNFILIKGKSDLIKKDELFNAIENWIKCNPAIYTLKAWESSFMKSKNETFWHLFKRSPVWPKILWKTYSLDSVDQNINLMDVVNKNITSRAKPIAHEEDVINCYNGPISKDEMKGVIQGLMYANKEVLSMNDLQPGDIFKIGGDYYLNLRPICDTVIGRMGPGETPNAYCDGEFYAIKGSKLKPKELEERYDSNLKMINERSNEVILFGVDGKDFFQFMFKKTYPFSYSEKKGNRISRLLSPYINNVQQKYSSYIGRFGLPRTPNEIIDDLLPSKPVQEAQK